ncbi:hypothetical protein BG004_000713 [Podila humilis]|nr:hypothetical protein BG004_000713 [Podila humilis]
MPTIDPAVLPISAPIPVPGSQIEPTTPSLSTTATSSSTTVIHVNGNEQGGTLRRFPSIGNTKKLSLENLTLKTKIAELERYLTGLKEELILAHRQIHSKNLEAKISQERKSVEIHELGQHIQRCEFDLLAKTAECEALQNKLAYQTKEQVTKLKHIHMLENEIMDYKRMSVMSGGAASTISTTTGTNSRIMSRHSRNSIELTTTAGTANNGSNTNDASVRSSAVLEAEVSLIKQLKEDNTKKENQIKELTERLENLLKLQQERVDAATAAAKTKAEALQVKQEEQVGVSRIPASALSISVSTSTTRLNTANSAQNTSSINSVGYDMSVEHPKLLARYQSLRVSHAQASEYLDTLESENRELKVQLLDVAGALFYSSENVTVEMEAPAKEEAKMDLTSTTATPTTTVVGEAAPSVSARLTPLDMQSIHSHSDNHSNSTNSNASPESCTVSPSSTNAPALTRKSSLRYNRDGQSSPSPPPSF